MKFSAFPLLILICCIGCQKLDPDKSPLISKIEAFDVGNAGNATDIRVRFEVTEPAGIEFFRILIVPTGNVDGLSKKAALVAEHFLEVPSQTNPVHSIRLSDLKDITGASVTNDVAYSIHVVSQSSSSNELSLASNSFILRDTPPYTGNYEWKLIIDSQMPFDFIREKAAIQYKNGQYEIESTIEGSAAQLSFIVSEDKLLIGLEYNWISCGVCNPLVIRSHTGTGTLRNDLDIIMDWGYDYCLPISQFSSAERKCPVIWELRRVVSHEEGS